MSPSSIRILFFICKAFQSWLCLPLHQYLSPFSPLRLKCLPQWALSVHPTHLLLPTLMSLHFLFSTKNDFPSPLHNTLSILWYLGWNIASSRSLPWPLHLQKKQSIPNPLPANKHTHTVLMIISPCLFPSKPLLPCNYLAGVFVCHLSALPAKVLKSRNLVCHSIPSALKSICLANTRRLINVCWMKSE